MASKSGRNAAVTIKPEELVLACEWMDCKDTYQCMDEFTVHVTNHLTQFLSTDPKQSNEQSESFPCHWRECNTEVDGETSDYLRHVFFHVFHVKIKCIGALLIEKTGRKACTLGTHCRNLIPELPEKLECGWELCHEFYENAEMFYRHVENHASVYPDGNNVAGGCSCQWEGCNVKMKSRYKLREHLRSHTQEKIVACPTCGNLFSNRTKYFDHVTRQMDMCTGKRYQCSHCNRTFPLEKFLRDHMRNHVNQYKCPYCDMTMPSPACLRKHISYRHTEEKPYKCEECPYRSKSAPDLKKHMEVHSNEGAYQCDEENCSYSARSYANLASHIKHVHQDTTTVSKYQCHVCDSNFTRGSKLTNHLKEKHNFSWPSGHSRFRYKLHSDGLWRLQTVRYETVDLSVHPDLLDQQQDASTSTVTSTENTSDNQDTENTEDIVITIESNAEADKIPVDTSENDLDEATVVKPKRRKIENTDTTKNKREIVNSNDDLELDNSVNMVELSITKTNDGKLLFKTAGCSMEEPMTIMMSDYNEEMEESMYNLQMLGDVALQNSNLK